jgi:hypothetical protein
LHSYQEEAGLCIGVAINTQLMLTEALPLDSFPHALDLVRQGKGVKTQILPNG